MTIEELAADLEGVKAHGDYWMAKCPAHQDGHASLQVSQRPDGSLGVFCQAGCDTESVMAAIGRSLADLFPEEQERVYTYRDERGNPLYDVVRRPGKEFLQRRYEADGTVEWGIGETRKVPYRLPEIIEAGEVAPKRWVFIVEGEKDAEAFWERGYIATCNVGGAGKWLDEYSEILRDRYVSIVRDKDDAGAKHAAQVMLSMHGRAKQVRLIEAREGKDAYDHFARGYGVDDFLEVSAFKPIDFTGSIPQTEWIWEGYIAKGDLVLLSGIPKLGKSWITMALATVMANENGVFLGSKAEPGRVLYFDEENPDDVVWQRLLLKLGHKRFDALRYNLNVGLRLDRHPELLMQEVLLYRPKLIVIDSLARVHSKDENSFSEMSEILNGVLKPLARDSGAGVILIHHHDKAGHGPRGSSDIEAAVDGIMDVRGKPGEGHFWINTKGRRSSGQSVHVELVDVAGGGVALRQAT